MRSGPSFVYLWPGLPDLWRRGAWSGLAIAIGWSVLLNVTLLVSLVWTDLATPGMRLAAWALVAWVWLAALWLARRQSGATVPDTGEDLFCQATAEYLQGNWFEAEQVLQRLIGQNQEDVEAHLMMATLYRHTRRIDEAHRMLGRLEQLPGSTRWRREIQQERLQLSRKRSQTIASA